MSGDIGSSLGKRCCWHLVGQARDVATHSAMHRTAPQKERSSPSVSGAEVEKPCREQP